MEDQSVFFLLEDEPEIEATTALQEGHNTPQPQACMEMGFTVSHESRFHRGENLLAPISRNTFEKSWRGL
jgi:hypothetical protein